MYLIQDAGMITVIFIIFLGGGWGKGGEHSMALFFLLHFSTTFLVSAHQTR
jgi:hypothetical protein